MTAKHKPLRLANFDSSSAPSGFNWDGGSVAFMDPLELIEKKNQKRIADRVRDTKRGKHPHGIGLPDNRKNFHLKHG